MERYIVFDVETPNFNNNRMSAIGVAIVEDGEIARHFGTVVNPECHFDAFNVRLTGITPAMAADAPTFPQLWEFLEPYFSDGVLAAHNAPFDLGVLGKCLRDYGIAWKPYAEYICTCRLGRRVYPELPDHKLDTMCRALGIPLDHHKADSDALAAAELLVRYHREGADIRRSVREYWFAPQKTGVCER